MRCIFQSVYGPTSHFTAFSNRTDRLYGPPDRKVFTVRSVRITARLTDCISLCILDMSAKVKEQWYLHDAPLRSPSVIKQPLQKRFTRG